VMLRNLQKFQILCVYVVFIGAANVLMRNQCYGMFMCNFRTHPLSLTWLNK
jgi:hypothetical protein